MTIAGVRRTVHTQLGLRVLVAPSPRRPDLVIVPALGAETPNGIVARLEGPDVVDARERVAAWRAAGVRVGGARTATFVLRPAPWARASARSRAGSAVPSAARPSLRAGPAGRGGCAPAPDH
jgi:hypothetical protein